MWALTVLSENKSVGTGSSTSLAHHPFHTKGRSLLAKVCHPEQNWDACWGYQPLGGDEPRSRRASPTGDN
jgi:hypothetical protein